VKSEIIAGDSLNFLTTTPNFPASQSWVLTYKLIPLAGGTPITITASAEGDDHRVTVLASVTALYAPMEYSWEAYVTKALERYTVDSGTVKVLPDPSVATTLDNRSHARKMLALIELALEGHATNQQLDLLSSAIGTRVWNRDVAKLLPMRDQYRKEVWTEDRQEALASGQADPNKIRVRFNRV
jgi:hypothetical protein